MFIIGEVRSGVLTVALIVVIGFFWSQENEDFCRYVVGAEE